MTNTNINFTEERNGYSRTEVDGYIKKISEAYQATYNNYQDICNKYNSLIENCKKSDAQKQAGLSPEVISTTLLRAEVMAQKIVLDANDEAAAIKKEAQKNIDKAEADAGEAKAAAQKILADAHEEAALIAFGARRNLEQAQKAMENAVNEVQKFLTLDVPETTNALVKQYEAKPTFSIERF